MSVTNRLALGSDVIIQHVASRMRIKGLSREMRHFPYFDHYQVRPQRAILRHPDPVLLAHAQLSPVLC